MESTGHKSAMEQDIDAPQKTTSFSEQEIIGLVAEHYGLTVRVKTLNGYEEQNFLMQGTNEKKYILKIATDAQGYDFLDAQLKIIGLLSGPGLADKFQKYQLNRNGSEITLIKRGGINYYLRVLSYLEGEFWVEASQHPEELLLDLGRFLGGMDLALRDFKHLAMHRHYEWDIATTLDARRNLRHIKDHERRRIAGYFFQQFETVVTPQQYSLRKAYIHNDANDYNVLVKGSQVSGLIDFGDMVYTDLINNVAVACTYALFGQKDPVAAAALVVKGYHEKYPLTEQELSLLYYLIAGRLCISVTQSAYNASLGSANEHHFITERSAWNLLFQLIKTNPVRAQNAFYLACGYQPLINEQDEYAGLLKERNTCIGKNLSVSYKKNIKIVKGALQYLYDDKGNTYLDCVNNVSHVGHCHPTVVKAMQTQIATLNTNTRYLHDGIVDYAKMLTATLPKELSVCYFTNSGSEANDLAIRMSRHFTKQKDVIVLDHAYHGTSTTAIELSPYKFDGRGGFGKMPYIHKAKNPDQYRGEYRYADKEAGPKYAADIQRILNGLKEDRKGPAAFICETLLGVGGQIPLPPGYLQDVYRYIRAAGGICIADEVQVGFGRVGECFWGFELQGAVPDMVVLGKPIGNGHPLAAVVTTPAIAEAFNNGMEYFNTFGGNPVSMITGMAVLEVIREEELQRHALEVGNFFMDGLKGLMTKYPIIGDVRGSGLFIGAEMVRDRETLEPAVPEIDIVVEKMKYRGFLISTDGPLHNVLKIKPPVIFSRENAETFIANLDEVLSEF
ncbi:aminotransferase class III-fold pyridoxal phosphate-dependent enzyme [Flavitalea flava]